MDKNPVTQHDPAMQGLAAWNASKKVGTNPLRTTADTPT